MRTLKHGDKRDYPKIWIFANGRFLATTTWSKTCREAVAHWHDANGSAGDGKITASFAKE